MKRTSFSLALALAISAFATSAVGQEHQHWNSLVVGDDVENCTDLFDTLIVGKANDCASSIGAESATIVGVGNRVDSGAVVVGFENTQESGEPGVGANSAQFGNRNRSNGTLNIQTGYFNETDGSRNTTSGNWNSVSGDWNAVSGDFNEVEGNTNVVNGSMNKAVGNQQVAIGYMTQANADGCVAIGSGSQCHDEAEFSVGNAGYQRRVTNVAPGINLTDAATVGQVAPIADALGGGANFNGGMFTGPVYFFRDNTSHANVGSALDNLDARVFDLENADNGPGQQGPRGYSAYEVAVQNGFEGSEQDWLESLHGRDGVDGRDGRDGVGGGSTVKPGTNIEVVDNDDNTQSVYLSDTVELSEQGSVSVGGTRVDAQGVHIQGGPSMTRNGIHAGNQRITGVAPGRIEQGSTDAINGGQLWEFERRMDDRWHDTNRNIERVGAQSAALSMMNGAATYLPVGKVSVNAGWGQYGSQSAFAVGAKARLSERSSLNIGFSFSGGKAMGGVGYSFIID